MRLFSGLLFSLALSMLSCARYEPIPWRDADARRPSLDEAAGGLIGSLAASAREDRLRGDSEGRARSRPLRVVVAGFAEARSGARTTLSLRIEQAVRRRLAEADVFRVVGGRTGAAWQEAFSDHRTPPAGGEGGEVEIRYASARELDADHPLEGLWPKARASRYGEESAIYAASMLGAEAAVYGAYALDENRVRVWAALALNAPSRSGYYRRGIRDVFGEAVRRRDSRPSLGYARVALPLRAVPRAWLTKRAFARPRARPAPRKSWGRPSFEAAIERMNRNGVRKKLYGGETIPSHALVLGRLRVYAPLYVYGFSIDEAGKVSELLGSAEKRGEAVLLRPDTYSRFTMRLRDESKSYRIYFASRAKPFSGASVIRAARARLGLSARGEKRAFTYMDVARGAPERPWTPPAGQDRLILGEGWGQEVFWFHALSGRAGRL